MNYQPWGLILEDDNGDDDGMVVLDVCGFWGGSVVGSMVTLVGFIGIIRFENWCLPVWMTALNIITINNTIITI